MRKLLLLSALAFVLGLVPALESSASGWGFLTYHSPGSWAMCTGEADGYGDDGCDVTTSWGTRVKTQESGGDCAASIYCPGNVVKTCYAGPIWGGWKPAICFATTANGGDYKAECKSDDYGAFALRCD